MSTKLKTKNFNINKRKFNDWLNSAIWFSIWHVSDKKHVIDARNFIFKDIGEEYYHSRDKAKDKAMLMSILLNLWVGFCTGSPIQISLNNNKYSRNGVYGKVFFSFRRTTRLLDELETRGYLQRKTGYFFGDDKKETRIWGTEKLLRLFLVEYKFQLFGDIYQDKSADLIQLNQKETKEIWDKKKKKSKKIKITVPVKFDPTEETIQMENNLFKYNEFAKEKTITVKIQAEDLIKPKILTEAILQGLNTGAIRLVKSELNFKDPLENKYPSNLNDSSSVLPVSSHLTGQCSSNLSQGSVLHEFSSIPELKIIQHSYKEL